MNDDRVEAPNVSGLKRGGYRDRSNIRRVWVQKGWNQSQSEVESKWEKVPVGIVRAH